MRPAPPPRLRPERLIAGGRVVLAVFSLFAVWLDPAEPAKSADLAYGLLVAYVFYAVAVAALAWRATRVSRRWPIVTHSADLIFFSLFIFYTTGPGSPFTVYFVFVLVCGALRWQARGAIASAAITLTVFVAFGLYFGLAMDDPAFDLRAFIIRGVYLFVIAVLLSHVGLHEHHLLREMRLLVSWPQTTNVDIESMTRDLLRYADPLLGSSHAMLAWIEPDSPWVEIVSWHDGAWAHERRPAAMFRVPSRLAGRAFLCVDGDVTRVLVQTEPNAPELESSGEDPAVATFLEAFHARSVLSAPIVGQACTGHLFVFDKEDATRDDLTITEIMAGVVASRLDAFYLNQALRVTAAVEERIRLARDLHDGVLQSFTGVALRLAAIRAMLARTRPGDVRSEVEHLQHILAAEQRELRFFIQELKPTAAAPNSRLPDRLRDLAGRIEREWDLTVDLQVDLPGDQADRLSRDVYHLVREALVNSARHGGASAATVRVTASGASALLVVIEDDGEGFTFRGRYSAEALAELQLGPKTLRERVRALHGTMTVESGPTGVAVHIVLPSAAA